MGQPIARKASMSRLPTHPSRAPRLAEPVAPLVATTGQLAPRQSHPQRDLAGRQFLPRSVTAYGVGHSSSQETAESPSPGARPQAPISIGDFIEYIFTDVNWQGRVAGHGYRDGVGGAGVDFH